MVREITPEIAQQFINGKFIGWDFIHDHTWEYEAVDRFWRVLNLAWKFYLPVHAIPMVIFKFKMLKQQPMKFLYVMAKNTVRSCLFLSTYIAVFKYLLWFFKNTTGNCGKQTVGLAGFFSGFALLWEPLDRRTELALYFLPRFLETFWKWLKQNSYVVPIPYGEVMLFAFAMSVLMYWYQYEKDNIKRAYLSAFDFFWGKN